MATWKPSWGTFRANGQPEARLPGEERRTRATGWRLLEAFVRRRLDAFIDWCRLYPTPGGAAHLAAVVVYTVQVILIDWILYRFAHPWTLLTLVADIPLLFHLVWYWREEFAHKAAPTQWLVYSWVHSAKVVVLFCRVMPRLSATGATSGSDARVSGGDGRNITNITVNSSSVDNNNSIRQIEVVVGNITSVSYFGTGLATRLLGTSEWSLEMLFSPTMLGTFLLITPLFYALLMFRTSKSIFRYVSNSLTVDKIMHYDMMWHVVVDMVDQVDMFYFARLAEKVGKEKAEQLSQNLIYMQKVLPILLFLSMLLQAQALPGVAVDRWAIPVRPPELQDQEKTSDAEEAAPSHGHGGGTKSDSLSLQPSRIVGRLQQLRPRAAVASPSAVQRAAEEGRSLYGGAASSSSAPPPRQSDLGAGAGLGMCGPQDSPTPGLPPVLEGAVQGHAEAELRRPDTHLFSEKASIVGDTGPEPNDGIRKMKKGQSDTALTNREAPALHSVHSEPDGRLPPKQFWSEPLAAGHDLRPRLPPLRPGGQHLAIRHSRWGAQQGRAGAQAPSLEVAADKLQRRLQKTREKELKTIIELISRQSIVIARNRSAQVSIFFTDIPFLAVRLWLWFMLGLNYFPAMAFKNIICLVLNVMQYTLVGLSAGREAFDDIHEKLSQYHARFCSGAGESTLEAALDGRPRRSPPPGMVPPTPELPASVTSTPQVGYKGQHSPFGASAKRPEVPEWRRRMHESRQQITRDTTTAADGVCLHFWALIVAFLLGLVLASGDALLGQFAGWFEAQWTW